MQKTVPNFVTVDSVYGTFVVNRHCFYQAETLVKTGKTHIEEELNTIFLLVDRLPDGAIIIDGGTNIGFFTIPVGQRVRQRGMRILGFEPQRPLFNALAGSIALNDLHHCSVFNLGLSEKAGHATLPPVDYSQQADFGLVQIQPSDVPSGHPYLDPATVKTIAIDDMRLPRVDFIKLDIEGHEPQAILGAHATIRAFRPLLWIEFFLVGEQKIREAFAGIEGYAFHIMDAQNMLCAPVEKLEPMGVTVHHPAK